MPAAFTAAGFFTAENTYKKTYSYSTFFSINKSVYAGKNTITASKTFKEIFVMSNSSNNKGVMTQKGREALERFKMESASELGINLKDGYNGDLTSREAGSIGGSMVNMMCPEQQWEITRNSVKSMEHKRVLTYYMQVGI